MKDQDCPFCASDSLTLWGEGGTLGRSIWVLCNDCGAQGPRTYFERGESDESAKARAYDGWNFRYPAIENCEEQ